MNYAQDDHDDAYAVGDFVSAENENADQRRKTNPPQDPDLLLVDLNLASEQNQQMIFEDGPVQLPSKVLSSTEDNRLAGIASSLTPAKDHLEMS
jgi:hypothetical protein